MHDNILMTQIIPQLFKNVSSVNEPRLIIVSGQPGAGKTYLINWFKDKEKNFISSEFGEMKLFYPKLD